MEPILSAIISAQQMKRQYETALMKLRNVVATGIGFKIAGSTLTDEPSVVVSVVQKLPSSQLVESEMVPKTLGNIKTDVIETGRIIAFQDPKQKMRPARPGVSIGHYQITAGTLGCLVQRAGEIFILSNNHVLANSNAAHLGDSILQPGSYDGGTLNDQIGTLEQFIPIAFDGETAPTPGCSPLEFLKRLFGIKPATSINTPGNNTVDCALARPLSPSLVDSNILNIGIPIGVGDATLGTAVQKSGRTTGYTQGQITQIDVTVSVDYDGKIATYKNQLMAGAMSQGGDSGSAVLNTNKEVVGLLFAGSNTTTIMNPIQLVFDALQVQIGTVDTPVG
jgi:hypothetical protein